MPNDLAINNVINQYREPASNRKRLDLSLTPITGPDLPLLFELLTKKEKKEIREISLSMVKEIEPQHLQLIKTFNHLSKITLPDYATKEHIAVLSQLKNSLTEIQLPYTTLNNTDMACFQHFKRLTTLNISHAKHMTAFGLTYLTLPKKLNSVQADNFDRMTAEQTQESLQWNLNFKNQYHCFYPGRRKKHLNKIHESMHKPWILCFLLAVDILKLPRNYALLFMHAATPTNFLQNDREINHFIDSCYQQVNARRQIYP